MLYKTNNIIISKWLKHSNCLPNTLWQMQAVCMTDKERRTPLTPVKQVSHGLSHRVTSHTDRVFARWVKAWHKWRGRSQKRSSAMQWNQTSQPMKKSLTWVDCKLSCFTGKWCNLFFYQWPRDLISWKLHPSYILHHELKKKIPSNLHNLSLKKKKWDYKFWVLNTGYLIILTSRLMVKFPKLFK